MGLSLTVIGGSIMKVRFAAAVAAFLISSSAQAAILVQNSELPTAMQGSFGSMAVSTFATTNMAAFGYTENSVAKWLIRYGVTTPSHEAYSSYDSLNGTSSSSTTPFTGYLWLSANQSYNLADASHQFTLFTDKVSPTPLSLWGSNSATFNLNSLALLAGSGFEQTNYNNGAYDSLGTMYSYPGTQWGGWFWACIECDNSVQFNLIMLKYFDFGGTAQLAFDASDSRALLFKQSDYTPDFGSGTSFHEQDYYVQPVPLPAALWLFASGLIGIGTITRKHILLSKPN